MLSKRYSLTSGSLESWLKKRNRASFPQVDSGRGEIAYPARYEQIKQQLAPYHKAVEKGALLKSAEEWKRSAKKQILQSSAKTPRNSILAALDEADPFVYLNNHGEGHVEKVIQRCSQLLTKTGCKLTAYEGFLLLCAIQFHDVGNIFGRKEHERKCKEVMESTCRQIIRDSFERNTISHIAMVHSGCWGSDPDTIESLGESRMLYDAPVRERLLAGLLRFSDELADDCTRCDRVAMQENIIRDGLIFHEYSSSLHTVSINKNAIELSFEFEAPLALKPLKKGPNSKFLLDEIYYRTLKMERERKYCMRFLRPEISIGQIRVEIIIQSAENPLDRDKITYTLEEKGYPGNPTDIKHFGSDLRTGAEERTYLKKKWKAR